MLVCAILVVLPAAANAATVSESFSSPTIPLNGTRTLTFTIDNPDASQHSLAFADALPAGLQVVGTPTTTCGVGVPVTTGPSNISFIGTFSDTPGCVVSASVQGVQVGHWDDPVAVTFDGVSVNLDASVNVLQPPAISAAFGTTLLGVHGTTPLTFTLTNPNQSFALTGVAFTDTLPAGLVLAGQPAAADGCGGTLTAAAGTDSLGLGGGQIGPGATCTVSATVAALAAGTLTDTSTQILSTEGGIGNTAAAALTVIGAPTVTMASPGRGRVYAYGQKVRAAFSCTDDPAGPGIRACTGSLPSGSLINTRQVGSHRFTVTATSFDGGTASHTVLYSVAPDNRVKLRRARGRANGSISFGVTVPGRGTLRVVETAPGHVVFARHRFSLRHAGLVRATIEPSPRSRAMLARRHSLRLTVRVTYTPRGGTARTTSFRVPVGG